MQHPLTLLHPNQLTLASLEVVENDLLVHRHAVAVVGKLLAELVQGFDGRISVRCCLVGLPVLLLEVGAVAHVVSEELRQVLGLAVGHGPAVVCGLPLRRGFLTFFGGLLRRSFLFFTFALGLLFLLLFLDNWLLNLVGLEHGGLLVVLQANDTNDLANVLLNGEEFVHESELEALLLRLQLARVAVTLEQDETLRCARFSNLLLDKLHNESLIEVDCREISFTEGIVVLGNGSEVDLLNTLGGGKGASKLGLRADLLLDQLVDGQVKHVVLDGEV